MASTGIAQPSGLHVERGTLKRGDEIYRGVGVNYFDAFYRTLLDADDLSYQQGFATLATYDIPFARFAATGFWPIDLQLYLDDPGEYFSRLDAVVDAAQAQNIGLIPSLFWAYFAVPDVVGESMNQWGVHGSATRNFMRTYTTDLVTHYRDRDTIWGWEFGNEYCLHVDLPNGMAHLPPVYPSLGTPETRSADDLVTSQTAITAFVDFAQTVRSLDATRPIFSGNAIPRASAWHNSYQNNWTQDTRAEFNEILLRDNPDPIDTLTVHMYSHVHEAYFADETLGYDALVGAAMEMSEAAGKPLFLGEFGVAESEGAENIQPYFEIMLTAIESHKVPLAAVWVFDRSIDTEWNITADNNRAFMLEAIQAANARIYHALHTATQRDLWILLD